MHFDGVARTVERGPFPLSGELVAGFWIWKVQDLDEAIAWANRCPNPNDEKTHIEIRPLFEPDDFAASDESGDLRSAEKEPRARLKG